MVSQLALAQVECTINVLLNNRKQTIASLSLLVGTSVLIKFSLTVKAATLIFISWCGSTIPSAKEGKSGFIYNLVKNQ